MHTSTATLVQLLPIAALLPNVAAHIALWDKGMFGFNWPDQVGANVTNWNNNKANNPLREFEGFGIDQWFGHGYKGLPPGAGDFMILPAGGRYQGQAFCGRGGTTFRNPNVTTPLPQYACTTEGPLHVANTFGQPVDDSKFGGTALAIAYTSDVAALQPNDMTVISVNHRSVWEREIGYNIPAGLPPCPEGGCLCTWNWIHQSSSGEGYGNEIYNNLYRCQVTGSTQSGNVVQRGQVPRECGSNPGSCVKGPKTPMYIYQAEGNNIPRQLPPPLYRANWGFQDGAQNDIFAAGSTPAPTTYIDNPYATEPTQIPASALPAGWSALGCYDRGSATQALDGGTKAFSNLTVGMCISTCSGKGMMWAGVEYGTQCWCGTTSSLVPIASGCDSRCGGDLKVICGGSKRINLFHSDALPSPSSSSTVSKTSQPATSSSTSVSTGSSTTTSPGSSSISKASSSSKSSLTSSSTALPTPLANLPTGWRSLGCVADSSTKRVLNGSLYDSSNALTPQACMSSCRSRGFSYAGVENGRQCYCGNTTSGVTTSATGCTLPCTGDGTLVCGGNYRMNLYAFSSGTASKRSLMEPVTVPVSPSTTSKEHDRFKNRRYPLPMRVRRPVMVD